MSTPGDGSERAPGSLPEERALLDAMREIEELLAAMDDESDDEPDAATQDVMRSLCTQDDAPLAWRSIAGRVESGTLTWQQVWRDPRSEGSAGVSLVSRAGTVIARDALATLSGFEEQLQQDADDRARRRFER